MESQSNLSKLSKEELLALAASLQKKEAEMQAMLDSRDKAIRDAETLIKIKEELIAKYQMMLFAKKTEKAECLEGSQGIQLSLFDTDDVQAAVSRLEEKKEELERKIGGEAAAKPSRKKTDLSETGLEVRTNVNKPVIPEGASDAKCIGRKHVKTIVRIPSVAFVMDEVYETWKYTDGDGGEHIVSAERKDPLMFRGTNESPEFVASTIYEKYVKSVPLYRQEKECQTMGIPVSRIEMSARIADFHAYAKPLVERIGEYIGSADMVRADETTATIVEINGESARRKAEAEAEKARLEKRKVPKIPGRKSYIWLFATGNGFHPAFYYKAGPGRNLDVVRDFFPVSSTRFLQTDGYGAYRSPKCSARWTNVSCLAHIRRGFAQIVKTGMAATQGMEASRKIVASIDVIYQCDRMIRKQAGDDFAMVKELRNQTLRPLAEKLFDAMEGYYPQALPKSAFGRALKYAIGRRETMMNLFLDGRIDLDNNYTEREGIKPFVIGRKNWLISDTLAGCEITCGMYTLSETAAHNGLDVYKYLLWLMRSLPEPTAVGNDYDRFLPWSEEVPEDIRLPKKKK